MPKVAQLVGGGAGIGIQAGPLLSHRSPVPTSFLTPSPANPSGSYRTFKGLPLANWWKAKDSVWCFRSLRNHHGMKAVTDQSRTARFRPGAFWIILFFPHHDPKRRFWLSPSPFYGWRTWDSVKLSNLPRSMFLVGRESVIWMQGSPRPCACHRALQLRGTAEHRSQNA